ncbi:MAG: PAS domain S-box protein, partial [Bacteroidota bacterium]
MFKGIALKIWLPFILITFFVGISLIIYIPSKQRQIIIEQKQSELSEVAKNLALSVEFSIKDEDFSSLKKSMDYVKRASEISFIAVYSIDESKDTSLFEIFPAEARSEALSNNKNDIYILSYSGFKTNVLSGYVKVAQKKQVIEKTISQILKPIYIIILSAFGFTILLSLYIARLISKPLVQLADITKEIEKGNLDQKIPPSSQNDEVGMLFNGMESLRSSLVATRNVNIELTSGLEKEVRAKTKELTILLSQLKEAQALAKFGNLTYEILTDSWKSSEELENIFKIQNNQTRNLQSLLSLVKEPYVERLNLAFAKAIARAENFNLDLELKPGVDGSNVFLSFFGRVERDKNDHPKSIFCVVQDITERKQTEEEIRKLSLVAKNTSNGVVITNTNYEIIWVNESFTKITGYTLEEIRGKKPSIFQFEQTNPQTKQKIREALKERRSIQAEILNKGKSGNIYWLDIYIEPLYDDFGELNGFIAIEIDITERKHNIELQVQYIRKIEESERQIRAINESLE